MKNNVDDLVRLKRKIESAIGERERLRGEMRSLKRTIREMGFESIADLKKRIAKLKRELEKIDEKIMELKNTLEKMIETNVGVGDGNSGY